MFKYFMDLVVVVVIDDDNEEEEEGGDLKFVNKFDVLQIETKETV